MRPMAGGASSRAGVVEMHIASYADADAKGAVRCPRGPRAAGPVPDGQVVPAEAQERRRHAEHRARQDVEAMMPIV